MKSNDVHIIDVQEEERKQGIKSYLKTYCSKLTNEEDTHVQEAKDSQTRGTQRGPHNDTTHV